MTQYDNEFFRGPPEGSPTLATDQRPTGAEVFQARPEKTTVAADVPVTREDAPIDPPKKKSSAKRINKAIKLLASCMAAVVITEAAADMAATIEIPAEVPTGQYYAGQWPGVEPVNNGVYHMDMEADMGYQIQIPMDGNVWRLTADTDWRMCWWEGNGYSAYIDLENRETGVRMVAELALTPHTTDHEEDSYTTMTAPNGQTIYIRSFFQDLGIYGEEEGLSREMIEASVELRQALVDETFAGIQVTAGTEDGWQGLQISEKLYSQQSENWYGLGGFGDLDIHIPWVQYSEDYNLQNMTPYDRVTVNGITWSIYFTDNETYLWAVPNIEPEICLGGLTARFMCADADRRGEYISDEEWTGFTSASQRQTAVDILVECLQHHYALRERNYPRDWPWKGATDTATYWFWGESVKGTWVQFSFGDEAYRVDSTDPELRFHWDETVPLGDDMVADLEISRMVQNEEEYAIGMAVCRAPFTYVEENAVYRTVQATGGETLYLEFRTHYHGDGADFTTAEMDLIADQILGTLSFESDPDDSGWSTMLLCDTMHSPQNMEWSGSGIVGSNNAIVYIHTVEHEGLNDKTPCGTYTCNGITWTFYYEVDEEDNEEILWAVPDIEPDVCIGTFARVAREYYRDLYIDGYGYGDDLSGDDVNHAVAGFSEALAYIYPLGVEPEEPWDYILDWPHIGYIMAGNEVTYSLQEFSQLGTYTQFSLGDRSYRLDSANSQLRFFWNETTEVNGVMRADLYISHLSRQRDWRVELFVQNEPFTEHRDEWDEIDATITAPDGSDLYLRFHRTWYDIGYGEADPYDVFSGWVQTVVNAITASSVDPNGWGQVYICDLMTTPISENWDGNAKVTEDYEITHYSFVTEHGLQDLEPYAMLEFNGIVWTFVYEEEDDLIWGIPDYEDRVCIGASAKEMAAWFLGETPESDYLDAAVEGLAEGLSKYYPRRGFEMEPVEDPTEDLTEEPKKEYESVPTVTQTTNVLQFSFGVRGYRLASEQEDVWMEWYFTQSHDGVLAAEVTVDADFGAEMLISREPMDQYDGQPHGRIRLDNGDTLYWYCQQMYYGDESQMAAFMQSLTASEAVSGEWNTILIGDAVYTQQSLYWSGWETVEIDGGRSVMMFNLKRTYELELGEPVAQREINGINWTLYVTTDQVWDWPFIWAVPDIDPTLAIGSDYENAVYKYYEDNGMIDGFDGDIWTAESRNGAVEVIFDVLFKYHP